MIRGKTQLMQFVMFAVVIFGNAKCEFEGGGVNVVDAEGGGGGGGEEGCGG